MKILQCLVLQAVEETYPGGDSITRLDRLIKQAKKIGGEWKPHEFAITKVAGGMYRVLCELWNGVPGSLNPDNYSRAGVKPYKEICCTTKEAAHDAIKAEVSGYEQDHGMVVSPEPLVHDCCMPENDEERKAVWLLQGGTTMEYLAEREGITLEQYIRKEYGPPKHSQAVLTSELEKWADIIRWRKEVGKDVETTFEAIDPEGSKGCCDENSE